MTLRLACQPAFVGLVVMFTASPAAAADIAEHRFDLRG